MVNINLKIKTLEGHDNLISVDDGLLLSEFRACIEDVTTIKKESQRLIFRGRALIDETRTLKSYGLENDMAVHVVKRAPPTARVVSESSVNQNDSPNTSNTYDERHHQAPINSQNIIVGTVPLERTSLFADTEQTLVIIRSILADFGQSYNVVSDALLRSNQQSQQNSDDFTISVILRGRRDEFVDSPARERFDQLRKDLKKFAWMIATVNTLFNCHIDALLESDFDEPSPIVASGILASILQGMHDLDTMSMLELRSLYSENDKPNALISLADELDAWLLTEDEKHNQQLENGITMRHIVADDLSLLLRRLEIINTEFKTTLTERYFRVLAIRHTHETASYTARLLNCFTTAFSRIQHFCAHIYHNFSDFGVHVDANSMNRIFPQYVVYERENPPEANILFVFNRLREGNNDASRGVTSMSNNASTGNRVVSSVQQFLQRAGAPFHVSSSTGQNTQITSNAPAASLNIPLSGGRLSSQGGFTFGGTTTGSRVGVQGFRVSVPQRSNAQATPSINVSGIARPILGIQMPLGGFRLSSAAQQTQHPQAQRTQSDQLADRTTESMDTTPAAEVSEDPVLLNSQSLQAVRNRSNPTLENQENITIRNVRRSSSTSQLAESGNNLSNDSNIVSNEPISSNVQSISLPMRQSARVIPQPNSGRRDLPMTSLVGWRQLPANSPNALFVGPRPPTLMPIYTNDPHLPCTSRRLRNFELDARHNDFWTDSFTVSSGLTLREHSSINARESDNAVSTTLNSGELNDSSGSSRNRRNVDVRVNNFGESVFTDEQVFRDYVLATFEQVALNMADFQSSIIPNNSIQQQGEPISDSTQIFGFSPVVGGRSFGSSGARFFSSDNTAPILEGISRITAEIPIFTMNSGGNVGASNTINNNNNNNAPPNQSRQVDLATASTNTRNVHQNEFNDDLDEMD